MHPDFIRNLASKVKSGYERPEDFVRTFVEQLDRDRIPESLSLCQLSLQQAIQDYVSSFDCDSPEFAESYLIYNLYYFPGVSTEETMRLRDQAATQARDNLKALHDYFQKQKDVV